MLSLARMKDKKGKIRSSEQYLMITVMNSKQASMRARVCISTHASHSSVQFTQSNATYFFMTKAS